MGKGKSFSYATGKVHLRPVEAKLKSWKQREKIIKAAKLIHPDNIKFLEDLVKKIR